MTPRTTLITSSLAMLFLVACSPAGSSDGSGGSNSSGSGGTNGGSGGTSGGSGGTNGGSCAGTSVTANESNDYMFSSTLTFPTIKVKPMSNLTIDWGDVTEDFQHHTLDPKSDINQVLFIDWALPLSDLESKINADDIGNDFEGLPLKFTPDGNTTSAMLYDFSLATGDSVQQSTIDGYLDPNTSPASTHTFTAMVATGDALGQGTDMIQAFVVDSSSDNTTVKLDTNSTQLQFMADLHDLSPTYIPSGQSGIKLDWGKMKKNAMGRDFDATQITHVLLGKYTQSPTELEGDNFLNLKTLATDLYEGDITSGTVVDFSKLKTSGGNSFSGIDSDGTWLVALMCGGCKNPAPWYLTVLEPCN